MELFVLLICSCLGSHFTVSQGGLSFVYAPIVKHNFNGINVCQWDRVIETQIRFSLELTEEGSTLPINDRQGPFPVHFNSFGL